MPVIDTLVLFAAADSMDKLHEKGVMFLKEVNNNHLWNLPSFALLEFDLVLKSRGYSESDRMTKYALLMSDYANIELKTMPISAVWNYYCLSEDVPSGYDYIPEIQK